MAFKTGLEDPSFAAVAVGSQLRNSLPYWQWTG